MRHHTLDSLRSALKSISSESPSTPLTSPPHSLHPLSLPKHHNHPPPIQYDHNQTNQTSVEDEADNKQHLHFTVPPILKKKQTLIFNASIPSMPVVSSSNPLDLEWLGTKLKQPKPNTSRIWFQNINGI